MTIIAVYENMECEVIDMSLHDAIRYLKYDNRFLNYGRNGAILYSSEKVYEIKEETVERYFVKYPKESTLMLPNLSNKGEYILYHSQFVALREEILKGIRDDKIQCDIDYNRSGWAMDKPEDATIYRVKVLK